MTTSARATKSPKKISGFQKARAEAIEQIDKYMQKIEGIDKDLDSYLQDLVSSL